MKKLCSILYLYMSLTGKYILYCLLFSFAMAVVNSVINTANNVNSNNNNNNNNNNANNNNLVNVNIANANNNANNMNMAMAGRRRQLGKIENFLIHFFYCMFYSFQTCEQILLKTWNWNTKNRRLKISWHSLYIYRLTIYTSRAWNYWERVCCASRKPIPVCHFCSNKFR